MLATDYTFINDVGRILRSYPEGLNADATAISNAVGGLLSDALLGEGGDYGLGALLATLNIENVIDATQDGILSYSGGNFMLTTQGTFHNEQMIGSDETSVRDEMYGADGDDLLIGNKGNDALFAYGGQDILIGGEGNDSLSSSSLDGHDFMLGGKGNDDFTMGDNSTAVGGEGNDRVFGPLSIIHDAQIILGAGDDRVNRTVENSTVFLGTGNDSAVGAFGSQVFLEDGDDQVGMPNVHSSNPSYQLNCLLDAGNGNDAIYLYYLYESTLVGGAGDDTLIADDYRAEDTYLFYTGDGNDRIEHAVQSGAAVLGTIFINDIEIIGEAQAISASAWQMVIGGATFNFVLNGSNLVLTENGNTNDSITLANFNTVQGGYGIMLGDTDNLIITGTTGQDTLTGGIGNDTIHALDGDDSIYAGAGDDSVAAGGGNDTVVGGSGAGDDTYDGGAGQDWVTYTSTSAGITVNLTTGVASGSEIGTDTLSNIEHIEAGSGADALTGNTEANHILGGLGNDTVAGLAGADTLAGGGGTDTLSYAASGAGVTVNLATGAGSGGDAAGDVLSGFESITGSAYNDSLTGSTGNDSFAGGAGADSILGGDGIDTASYRDSTVAISVNLTTGALSGGEAQGDVFSSIENIMGSAFADAITGSGGNNALLGGVGADTLSGGFGFDSLAGDEGNDLLLGGTKNDTLLGGAGDDRLEGNADKDVLLGGEGNDTLLGGTSDNTLEGGLGADELVGDLDKDIFRFLSADDSTFTQSDRIISFDRTDDLIDLSVIFGINGFSDLVVALGGTSTEVTFGTSFKLILTGDYSQGANQLTAEDFVF